ncbi:hypothetical protein BHF70_04785 [Anaerostipes sp. 494a]|uniref:hypothetical protein n=1 Tax=Anaerostipes sp. 494a TaxID=1261636 RepID=UPI000951B2F1|nr:hypothetical protein [Anaerostipes sp. 494a]OLR58997.1 hypothetical protein BHF70_04785 [Anaerostipes sp. 494a]
MEIETKDQINRALYEANAISEVLGCAMENETLELEDSYRVCINLIQERILLVKGLFDNDQNSQDIN